MEFDFFTSDSGAVTVDWVVLSAGLVGLGLATMAVVGTGVQDTSGDIEDQLTTNEIISSTFTPETPVVAYTPYNLQVYDNVYNNTLQNRTDAADFNSAYSAAIGYSIERVTENNQADAQLALDELFAMEAAAATAGWPADDVVVDGTSYDAATLKQLYDVRFPN